jgi:hypothetical protein
MALNVTDVQGTKVYLAAQGADVSDAAAIVIAIAAGVQIGCLQALGDISETRAVQEYTCMSSDESTKSSGSISLGNQEISTLFNAADTAGQEDMIAMWDTNSRRTMIVEMNDQITPTTGNPTYLTYEIFASGRVIPFAKDAAILYNATMEQSSRMVFTLAT